MFKIEKIKKSCQRDEIGKFLKKGVSKFLSIIITYIYLTQLLFSCLMVKMFFEPIVCNCINYCFLNKITVFFMRENFEKNQKKVQTSFIAGLLFRLALSMAIL